MASDIPKLHINLLTKLYKLYLKAHSHQIKVVASNSKIVVNGIMQNQCNPTAFFQSKASRLQFKFGVNELLDIHDIF